MLGILKTEIDFLFKVLYSKSFFTPKNCKKSRKSKYFLRHKKQELLDLELEI